MIKPKDYKKSVLNFISINGKRWLNSNFEVVGSDNYYHSVFFTEDRENKILYILLIVHKNMNIKFCQNVYHGGFSQFIKAQKRFNKIKPTDINFIFGDIL